MKSVAVRGQQQPPGRLGDSDADWLLTLSSVQSRNMLHGLFGQAPSRVQMEFQLRENNLLKQVC